MADQIHSYVDEAGDPTLFGSKRGSGSIVGSNGCSRYFIMGKLEVDDPPALAAKLEALRLRMLADPYFAGVASFDPKRGKTAIAFHAKDDVPEVRYDVFRLLREEGSKLRFHAVIADKEVLSKQAMKRREAEPGFRYDPNSLYDALIRSLYGKFHRIADEYHVWIAKRGQRDRNEALLAALAHAESDFVSKFGFSRGPTDAWKLQVAQSKDVSCLQAVDYFLWALQRFYEPRTHPETGVTLREERFLNLLWPQIGEVHDLHFGGPAGTFYRGDKPLRLSERFPEGGKRTKK
ncbi:MAG: hypothetical protein EOP84_10860 [Verrucomicrobiaceae bacterium]|nr:MAG: hypothetical protein EOP84_10860 [Verrucomicrobiaceae bacterium]